jgi:hypothetical protein
MGLARLQSPAAKLDAVSMIPWSFWYVRLQKQCASPAAQEPNLCRLHRLPASKRAPRSQSRRHISTIGSHRPHGANTFNNHTPCSLGRCGDQPSSVPPSHAERGRNLEALEAKPIFLVRCALIPWLWQTICPLKSTLVEEILR